ncbi:MAG: isoprenylcysteine carboxylmethyltransferase family protein [Anaerolineales bacterium]|nr:isoprenylcysteine carboxylmethyltransferase family protein [Anaerolineales bacterium]
MTEDQISQYQLKKMVYVRIALCFPVLAVLFFFPAGTWNYPEAWIYIAIIFVPMLFTLNYLLKNDPELLERRMHMRETQLAQKKVVSLSLVYFMLAFLLPGFDKRFGWSNVPFYIALIADLFVLAGYLGVIQVFKTNSYASRVVEVMKGQKVISTGPYAFVRHPMYTATSVMYVFSPLALGSYWAMIPAALIIPLLASRIRNEEEVLEKELDGYKEYKQKTKYRLIPGIW